jgi:hypothetical protein
MFLNNREGPEGSTAPLIGGLIVYIKDLRRRGEYKPSPQILHRGSEGKTEEEDVLDITAVAGEFSLAEEVL